MPPFLMLLAVAFVVIMVMFGNNPVDKWRAEQEKYGRDPLAREINKFNDERSKKGGTVNKYTPPPGSTTYRLPPDQAQLLPRPLTSPDGEQMVRPAPDVPPDQWSNPYPSYMMAPRDPGAAVGNAVVYPQGGGTSLMPGRQ